MITARPILVYATDAHGAFGLRGGLPWPTCRADLAHFRRVTLGHVVIMGRLTHEATPELPDRVRCVVGSREPVRPMTAGIISQDLVGALRACELRGELEPRVIGGTRLLVEALPLASRVWQTVIDGEWEADVRLWPATGGGPPGWVRGGTVRLPGGGATLVEWWPEA